MTETRAMRTSGPVLATIRPPGSKSITNRALVCAAMSSGVSELRGALDSEDTRVMVDSLKQLGIKVEAPVPAILQVTGCGGCVPARQADLYVANSGTTMRFLTAILATAAGEFRLDGVPRMRERPIADLTNAMRQLGVEVQAQTDGRCPPVVIRAGGMKGGRVTIRGDTSSQFLSGLLMAAPLATEHVEIAVEGELVSKPYVDLTLAVMKAFGVTVVKDLAGFQIRGRQQYQACNYLIEPDASAASYFWGAAAITGGCVTVAGLGLDALQGDVEFCRCLERMGCTVTQAAEGITVKGAGSLKGIDVNMSEISDTAQTLAAVALFADGATRIRGVAHNRHKETDRIADLSRELRKLGAEVAETDDGLVIHPKPLRGAEIDTYRDHRMAMSMALVGLRVPGVVIRDPTCVEKTYPEFFSDLQSIVSET